ncbi:MAG: hypothetical protein V9E87_01700 [Gemmatimonadales bacterium]
MRRLVEDVEHADEARADLRGEADALRLAARERAGRAVEREVVQADVGEEAQPLDHFLEDRAGDVGVDGARLAVDRPGSPRRTRSSRPRESATTSPIPCPPTSHGERLRLEARRRLQTMQGRSTM